MSLPTPPGWHRIESGNGWRRETACYQVTVVPDPQGGYSWAVWPTVAGLAGTLEGFDTLMGAMEAADLWIDAQVGR